MRMKTRSRATGTSLIQSPLETEEPNAPDDRFIGPPRETIFQHDLRERVIQPLLAMP